MQAIDLIDEAGSRVRLRHAQLPEAARELDKELRALMKEKDNCVRTQDFEKASTLRDKELELKAAIAAIQSGAKKEEAAEAESGEGGGPLVTDQDIANIVAQWTGIPIEKVSPGSNLEKGQGFPSVGGVLGDSCGWLRVWAALNWQGYDFLWS
jgi:ATP-dependent Clp protease ATP-binding subunit ClpC